MTDVLTTKKPKLSRTEREDVLHRIKAREIVYEILQFGVTQSQILYIIRLLSLELEDMGLVQNLNDVIKQSERFANEGNAEIGSIPKKTKIYT